ncbi:hypothetical protein ACXR2T_11230 [Leucobacter sp. HY1910]
MSSPQKHDDPATQLDDALTSSERFALAQETFGTAQEEFQAIMDRDFPDFTVDAYATQKAAAEGISRENVATKMWAEAQAFPARLDLSGDGKLGFDDAGIAAKRVLAGAGKAWQKVTDFDREDLANSANGARDAVAGAGKKVAGFDYRGATRKATDRVRSAARVGDNDVFRTSRNTVAKLGKTATGIQGLQDRRETVELQRVSEEYVAAAEAFTEEHRAQLYTNIEQFGALRLESLHDTLGRFLQILRDLNQRNRVNEYELLDGVGIDTQSLESMARVDMTVSQTLRNTAATGTLGLAAVFGTPALVTSAVGMAATASTGTAISTLSGAAASNAVLAWLGGGSLAAGGGGMAAGAAVLTGITVGATAGVVLLAAGVLVSTHYARKLTEAKEYQKEAALAVAGLENAWLVMGGIIARVDELSLVTTELRDRIAPLLSELEELVPTFDAANTNHASLFSQCGVLVKTMVELAQVPLLDDDGALTDESLTISTRVRTVLNTEI